MAYLLPPDEPFAPSSGAVAVVVRAQVAELRRRGHAAEVFSPPAPDVYADVPVRVLNPRPLRRALGRLAARQAGRPHVSADAYLRLAVSELADSPYDVLVVANDCDTAFSLAAARPRTLVLLWLHNQVHSPSLTSPDMPANVHLVAVSDFIRRWTIDFRGVDASRITTIRNGVDISAFRPRSNFTARRDPVRVICHGRVDPNKGMDLAVAAVRSLQEEGLPVTIDLAGTVRAWGIAPADLSRYVADLSEAVAGLGGRMLGHLTHDRVPKLLAGYDVACHLSRSPEPFSLAVLEAMACGCAVVASTEGALPDVVADSGDLVSPNDPGRIAHALRTLVVDRSLLARRKLAASERAQTLTWPAAVDAMEHLLAARLEQVA